MFAYVVRRLFQMIPLLLAASFVIFALLALQPGDPLDEVRMQNPRITAEQLEALRKAYGLDDPIHIRYAKWLTRALQGDLGYSRTYGIPAAEYIFEQRLPRTLLLSGLALLLALLVSIPVGVFSAVRQYTLADYTITFLAFIGLSIPNFFLGILLLYLFAVRLPELIPGFPQFPTGGVPPFLFEEVRQGLVSLGTFLGLWAWHLILPVVVLSTSSMAEWTRFMRASLLEVLSQDYIRTARAKGLAERVVLYKHALRNALIPIVTLVGLAIPGVMSGAVLTETIFSYPGMGRAIFDALVEKDYSVAMAALAFLALMVALFNLLADLAYALVDPRIRYS
ncbi:ABC transporter permease [Thermus aquaticus]|jgi:peptide/nickel transport system permease protein|uniref:Dipeptide transport system permease protein DppB n=2 Tax=Thermus aquaticus TaxID=271 RepID=A0A0N0BL94_THEAQ|nr:ABC transporter permease [Thermus aquaticus]ALJ91896.1 Dipeptide transport system permease protein DppB [Thermus aquaticus Y51MC23]KOX89250.1 Dipeptide transport system permease protein DppB [Thermus aquaticus]